MDLFDKYDVRATFFVLGEVYEWYPKLIESISKGGHEIAFHTQTHCKISDRDTLIRELKWGEEFIKKFKIKGFRAPQMLISQDLMKLLLTKGFVYDSSLYSSLGKPFRINGLLEVPVSTYASVKKCDKITLPRTMLDAAKNFELPFGSGYFISLLSTHSLNKLISLFNKKGKSAVLFIHPWQLAEKLPKLPTRFGEDILKLPYRIRISREKLESLLATHDFTTIRDMTKELNLRS
jgi:peptidoglycan/xylan/chitin deacetylase (PgdA/CDA1 family)